jgi:hypothetical protein
MTETHIDPEIVKTRHSWAAMLSKRGDDRPMSTMKNNTEETQVFEGDPDPHYRGTLIENPTAEEWAEAVRVYCGNEDGKRLWVAIKSGTLTLLHLGDFGVELGGKYLVTDPTAEQWGDAVSRYLDPAMGSTGACVMVARRWDGNLSLFGCEDHDIVKPGECYTVGQAQSEIEEGMREAV